MKTAKIFWQGVIALSLIYFTSVAQGPYAPPVGITGTTAISADSPLFTHWANHATIKRGPMNIANLSAGNATVGDEISPTGMPGENGTVSLGDGGEAVLTFPFPIKNVNGPDFAIFENSFSNDFLELAFVEVSSDGLNFFRFSSVSLTDTTVQVGTFGSIDATDIYNLAGKYKGGFGTPFDLEELAGETGLNLNNITHIKVIDVVGCIDSAHHTKDSRNVVINDPWPTEFASGGFDLDAVGVINPEVSGSPSITNEAGFNFYPNPSAGKLYFKWEGSVDAFVEIIDLRGANVATYHLLRGIDLMQVELDPGKVPAGYYLVKYSSERITTVNTLVISR